MAEMKKKTSRTHTHTTLTPSHAAANVFESRRVQQKWKHIYNERYYYRSEIVRLIHITLHNFCCITIWKKNCLQCVCAHMCVMCDVDVWRLGYLHCACACVTEHHTSLRAPSVKLNAPMAVCLCIDRTPTIDNANNDHLERQIRKRQSVWFSVWGLYYCVPGSEWRVNHSYHERQ